jgi:hypothetical protein
LYPVARLPNPQYHPDNQKDLHMKKLAAALLACTLALTSAAYAGGPVIVEDTTVEAASPRSGWIVPVVVGLIVLCAIACGNDDEEVVLQR